MVCLLFLNKAQKNNLIKALHKLFYSFQKLGFQHVASWVVLPLVVSFKLVFLNSHYNFNQPSKQNPPNNMDFLSLLSQRHMNNLELTFSPTSQAQKMQPWSCRHEVGHEEASAAASMAPSSSNCCHKLQATCQLHKLQASYIHICIGMLAS